MTIYSYLDATPEQINEYVARGLLDRAEHPEFPLSMLTYGRETVHNNAWDHVTLRCRGIIFNRETGEVIARPFEKFFNLGTANMPETDPESPEFMKNLSAEPDWTMTQPTVYEKVDGFLCTLYRWNGTEYIASKGSFTSPHAKWATAWYRKHRNGIHIWPEDYTPVFEGICPDLRIVVNYKERNELILLALIKIETGEELNPTSLRTWGTGNDINTPLLNNLTWQEASIRALAPTENEEGFVLT